MIRYWYQTTARIYRLIRLLKFWILHTYSLLIDSRAVIAEDQLGSSGGQGGQTGDWQVFVVPGRIIADYFFGLLSVSNPNIS